MISKFHITYPHSNLRLWFAAVVVGFVVVGAGQLVVDILHTDWPEESLDLKAQPKNSYINLKFSKLYISGSILKNFHLINQLLSLNGISLLVLNGNNLGLSDLLVLNRLNGLGSWLQLRFGLEHITRVILVRHTSSRFKKCLFFFAFCWLICKSGIILKPCLFEGSDTLASETKRLSLSIGPLWELATVHAGSWGRVWIWILK